MLEEKVLNTIQKYKMLQEGDKVVIGVSGGPDSITLLAILNNLKEKLHIKLYVAHINHKIREEAEEETIYVESFCKKREIACFVTRVKVEEIAKKSKIGTEEAGRNIRYAFFEEVANKVGANKIATAHNSNDNAETVLMNLLRGSSITGLKGIDKVRDGKYIRPLLECSREEIENYCQEEKLNPRYDKSNNENIYTRNKIRNLLIPYLQKEFNPNIIATINRLSEIAAKEEYFFNNLVEKEFEELCMAEKEQESGEKSVVLNLKAFNALDDILKARLLIYTIAKVYGTTEGIEKVHIEDIIKLCQNNIGNKYLTPRKGVKIYVKKGKIFFLS